MDKRLLALLLLLASNVVWSTEPLPADPTAPPEGKFEVVKETESVYQLNALLAREQSSWAIINGQRVNLGDEVDGAKVNRIDTAGVELLVSGQPLWLDLDIGLKTRSRK